MMNIETLLQAAQILEDQQATPSKKQPSARDECSIPETAIPTSILSSTTSNASPIILPTTSLIKSEQYPQSDLNIHVHQFIQQQARSTQQHFKSQRNDEEDDDDDDDLDQNTERNSEISTRTPSTCFRDREIHNRLEKCRRAHLKDCFDTLKIEVPCQRDRKITNLQVLNLAIKYIQSLKRKEREYENELASLASRNLELQQRLSTLKTELNSEGHNVDTWLNSCPEIDHSVSTRTASEAEMYRTFDDVVDDDADIEEANSSSNKSMRPEHAIDCKILSNHRKSTARPKARAATKKTLASIPTTNLLQTLTSSDNFLDYNLTRHLQLNQTCNLLTVAKDAPLNDIRYDIVDMFTKGSNAQIPQTSPLPSIASLMNRHASPIVSPVKQTIGINPDSLATSTTNILHQPVPTS